MKTLTPLSALVALCALPPAFAASPNVCDQTARTLFRACSNEIRDDRNVGYANCANVVDAQDQADCLEAVDEDYAESSALCMEQRGARLEVCSELGQAAYDQGAYWVPANFVDPDMIGAGVAPNPWFDLTPGAVNRFYGGGEEIEVTVTGDTKLIGGVTCRTVRDLVTEDGNAVEDTQDWYAQDVAGTVWYCGELAENYETFAGDDPEVAELVDIEGSWKAFRDRAQPGVLFTVDPAVDDFYRQEAAWGDAEDVARVLSVTADGLLEGDDCSDEEEPTTGTVSDFLESVCEADCLVTLEFTAVEPDVYAHKYYAPGVGLLAEVEDGVCVVKGEPPEADGAGA